MAGGVCPFTLTRDLLYHALLTGVILIVVTAQGILLDVYILANDHTAIVNYFWLLPDFLMIFVFVAAMARGYRNCKAEKKGQANQAPTPNTRRHSVIIRNILGPHVLPFYVWVAYSIFLVTKIAIIFKSEMPSKVGPEDQLSPQLLKAVISVTAIVFALLVEGQTISESNSERDRYIKYLSHGTAFEILDSVTFLSLLIQSESRLVLPLHLENAIISFACINFFLPAIALIKLSRSNYGKSPVCIISSIIYKLSHLWLINFTFFVIRIYLWAGLSVSVSPFVVKNIYHMFSVMHMVFVDFKTLKDVMQKYLNRKQRVSSLRENATGETELNAGNNWNSSNDKFEEIDLKQDPSDSV